MAHKKKVKTFTLEALRRDRWPWIRLGREGFPEERKQWSPSHLIRRVSLRTVSIQALSGLGLCYIVKKILYSWTHTCNPNYSGGRDQEDHSSKPAWANSSPDPIPKKSITHTQRAGKSAGSKSACLASVRPWDQTLVPPKKKKFLILLS
jgi:hypothetical protein